MKFETKHLTQFFGVIIRRQPYLNFLYLLLAFPLGVFYFIFLVVGLSLGISLIIIWVGLLILPIVFAVWWTLAAFERQLAIWLLNENIPPMARQGPLIPGWWEMILVYLRNPVTWKSLVYLFVKFILGIVSFVVVVTLGTLTISFVTMPAYYWMVKPQIWITWQKIWEIDSLPEALIMSLIGLGLLFLSLHIFNGLAWLSGKFARLMLGDYRLLVAPALVVTPNVGVVDFRGTSISGGAVSSDLGNLSSRLGEAPHMVKVTQEAMASPENNLTVDINAVSEIDIPVESGK